MAIEQKRRRCRVCGRKTLHQREVFSFGMGLLLTLLTAGLFVVVWGPVAFADLFKRWRCQSCGN